MPAMCQDGSPQGAGSQGAGRFWKLHGILFSNVKNKVKKVFRNARGASGDGGGPTGRLERGPAPDCCGPQGRCGARRAGSSLALPPLVPSAVTLLPCVPFSTCHRQQDGQGLDCIAKEERGNTPAFLESHVEPISLLQAVPLPGGGGSPATVYFTPRQPARAPARLHPSTPTASPAASDSV